MLTYAISFCAYPIEAKAAQLVATGAERMGKLLIIELRVATDRADSHL